MAVSVIAGLGNPGETYRQTRHNVGFALVDALAVASAARWQTEKRFEAQATKVSIAGHVVLLVKPQTYMNDSGRSLGALMRFFRLAPSELCVIYDDITLEAGRLKLSLNGSDGGHNGIASILQHLESGFVRYRIGIGAKAHPQMLLKDWVLGKQSAAEKALFEACLPDYLRALECLVTEGVERAMNQFNTRT